MKIAVCDDDKRVLDSFQEMLRTPEYQDRVELECFSGAEELLEACESRSFDLIFSDIMLDGADGIKTAAQVSLWHPGVRVVFITSHVLEYAEEIFSAVQPYGYIGKPVYAPKVDYYIRRLEAELARSEQHLTVSMHGVEYAVLLSDIRFLESDRRQVHIHCARKVLSVYEKLDNIQRQLDSRFVRCHQSYLVNLDWVIKLDSNCLVVRRDSEDGEDMRVSISRNHLAETRKSYFEYKGRAVL